MSYWELDALFLGAVAAVAIVVLAVRRGPRWTSIALGGAVLLLLTAVFDNVMIGIGLVGYDRALISGVFVGAAPIEDFAYAVAAIVLLPCLWTLLGHRRDDA
jgi:lycopene cyclase domain-containing protein